MLRRDHVQRLHVVENEAELPHDVAGVCRTLGASFVLGAVRICDPIVGLPVSCVTILLSAESCRDWRVSSSSSNARTAGNDTCRVPTLTESSELACPPI
jgi:hypothetical protein